MVAWLGPAIGAAASLAGGLLGQSSAAAARGDAERLASENIKLQKDFAQQGIRWKVNDAKLAGIHPLAALGANTMSFSPVSISGGADMSLANSVSNMGQDISRAVNATRTSNERERAMMDTARAYQLEGLRLDNEIKRAEFQSRMQRLYGPGTNPALPGVGTVMPGQGNTRSLPDTTELLRSRDQGLANQGSVPDVAYLKTTSGGIYPAPSEPAKQLIEDNIFQEGMHFLRNNVIPWFSPGTPPGQGAAPPGYKWSFDGINGYRLKPDHNDYRTRGSIGPRWTSRWQGQSRYFDRGFSGW